MLVSTKGRYALRVLINMAEHQTENRIPLKAIVQRQEMSEKLKHPESAKKRDKRCPSFCFWRGPGQKARYRSIRTWPSETSTTAASSIWPTRASSLSLVYWSPPASSQ